MKYLWYPYVIVVGTIGMTGEVVTWFLGHKANQIWHDFMDIFPEPKL